MVPWPTFRHAKPSRTNFFPFATRECFPRRVRRLPARQFFSSRHAGVFPAACPSRPPVSSIRPPRQHESNPDSFSRATRWIPRRARPVQSIRPRLPPNTGQWHHCSSSPNLPHETHPAVHPPELTAPHFAGSYVSSSFCVARAAMGCVVVEVQDTSGLSGIPTPSTPFIRVLPSYSVTDETLKPPSAFLTTHLPPSAAIKIAYSPPSPISPPLCCSQYVRRTPIEVRDYCYSHSNDVKIARCVVIQFVCLVSY
jgi:hypothetical protein